MKKTLIILLFLFIFTLTACSGNGIKTAIIPASQNAFNSQDNGQSLNSSSGVVFDNDDLDSNWTGSKMSYITLKGDSITVKGNGVVVDGNKIAITAAGTYYISGKLDDGQIVVKAEDGDTVKLILYEADITCSTSAPIYVHNAKKAVITLAEGTKNYITDGSSYSFADSTSDEPNAAIFSKDDLSINGNGSLVVKANYYNGIQSKDDLKIAGGNITIDSINDSIKGRDSIAVKYGNITVKSGGDGMQSNNDEDSAKGYIAIEAGTLDITAAKEGIQAETRVLISGGDISISSGGGSSSVNFETRTMSQRNPWAQPTGDNSSSDDSSISTKGIKGGADIVIDGGRLKIDSYEDALHSNHSLTINGGDIVIASGDDGIHADSTLTINGGDISIDKCYEGAESAAITINSGSIRIVSADDGINVVGGNDIPQMMGPQGQNMVPPGTNINPPTGFIPGRDNFNSSGDNYLKVTGGYIYVNANGDGLDINGSTAMTGGTVIVNGPTANDNGAIDSSGFKMTGGYLVAVGSSGMAQSPDTSSTQYSVLINLATVQPANNMIHIEAKNGESILTFIPVKTYQSIALCSPQLKNGSEYTVYTGGSSTGKVTDGLYSDGSYTPGTQAHSFTISGMVTSVGESGGRFPGGGWNMRPGR